MKTILAWGLGAFLMFAALGYHLGRESASDPYRVSAYIANNTDVSLTASSIEMRFHDKNQRIVWRMDLAQNIGRLDTSEGILTSLRPKTLSAESDLLLKFVGGGALAVSAKDIVQNLVKAKKGNDLRVKVATLIGGVTGFGIGYYLGIRSIDSSSSEVLSFFREKKNVELLKKVVYASMLSKVDPDRLRQQDFDLVAKDCEDSKDKFNCILKSPKLRTSVERSVLRDSIFQEAVKRLSSNDAPLEGYEFVAFFI